MKHASAYERSLEDFASKLQAASAVVVGTGTGFASAAGLTFYKHGDASFRRHFGQFADAYRLRNVEDGLSYTFPTDGARWAFLATHAHVLAGLETPQVHEDLARILDGKRFHIVTLCADWQLSKTFGDSHVSSIQGDYRYLQCYSRCHDALYECTEQMEELFAQVDGVMLPDELVPRCPECGTEMEPWVYGYRFLEGERYEAEYGKWEQFILSCQQENTMFLELGLGRKRKELVKQPFRQFALGWPQGSYVAVSASGTNVPAELEDRALLLEYDIDRVLGDMASRV